MSLDPKNPALLGRILFLYHQRKRLTGEDKNILTLFQAFVGAVQGRPAIIPVKGSTRGGKSRLVKTVLPPFKKLGFVLQYSRITPTFLEHLALEYLPKIAKTEQEEVQPGPFRFTVEIPERILYVDELRGASQATEPIKLIFSEGRLRLGTVIRNRPVEIELKGIKVIVTTTTSTAFSDPEFDTRTLPLQIDETQGQTGRVLDLQGEEGEELEEEEDDDEAWEKSPEVEQIANFLNQLRPVRVAIPFSRELAKQFPRKSVFERGEFPKMKRFLRNLASIHQFQRARIKKPSRLLAGIAADPVDWEYLEWIGLPAFKESFTGFAEKEQKVYDLLKTEPPVMSAKVRRGTIGQEEADIERGWTVQNLAPKTEFGRKGQDTLRKVLQRMVDDGYVEEDDSKGKPYRYSITALQPQSFDVSLKQYHASGLEVWAQETGHSVISLPNPSAVFIDPVNVNSATAPFTVETSLSEREKLESCCDSSSQHELVPTGQTQQGILGNDHVALLTPSDKPETLSDNPERPSDTPIIAPDALSDASDKPVNMSDTPPGRTRRCPNQWERSRFQNSLSKSSYEACSPRPRPVYLRAVRHVRQAVRHEFQSV